MTTAARPIMTPALRPNAVNAQLTAAPMSGLPPAGGGPAGGGVGGDGGGGGGGGVSDIMTPLGLRLTQMPDAPACRNGHIILARRRSATRRAEALPESVKPLA